MKILFLPRYDRSAASCRVRYLCYEEFLGAEGIDVEVAPLFNKEYLDHRYKSGRGPILNIIQSYWHRIVTILFARRFDLVVIHLELFPYFPHIFELYLKWVGVPFIYDFDDPFYRHYEGHSRAWVRWMFGNKIKKIIARSNLVIAGNEYLASYAATAGKQAHIVPSVVDLRRYPRTKNYSENQESKPFVIGWIGVPDTTRHLRMIEDVLKEFCRGKNAKVLLVGAGDFELHGVPIEKRAWSEARESEDLLSMDIGIMPLFEDPFTRGKGGMKIMQYMASAIPAIASPVTFNCEIIKDGVNGFLPSSSEDWLRVFEKLYSSAELRQSIGLAGRKTIEEKYCLQKTSGLFLNAIHAALRTAA